MRGIDADDDVLEVVVALAVLRILEADLEVVLARQHARQDLRGAAGIEGIERVEDLRGRKCPLARAQQNGRRAAVQVGRQVGRRRQQDEVVGKVAVFVEAVLDQEEADLSPLLPGASRSTVWPAAASCVLPNRMCTSCIVPSALTS